jgi:predicted amidohydrolase YtcJ
MKLTTITINRLAVLLGLFVFSSCSSSVPDVLAPDLVMHNGKIVTVDEDFSIAEAVAIKDGNIVAVGSNGDVLALAGSTTERMDLEGKTVLPGFNDSHLHLAWPVGEAPNPAIRELGAARSIGEIVDIVRKEVEGSSPGELVWIPFGPAMEIQIKEKRWPNKNDLDPVSPDNPVIVTFAADGVYVTNTMGLAKANINRRTPQPYKSGLMGEFEIDRRGNPTGVMKGRSAGHMLREPLGVWSTDILEENIARSIEADVIPYGITSLADPAMASNNQPIQHAFQRVANRKEGLPARVNLMIRIPVRALSAEACVDLIQGLLFEPPFKNDFFRVGTFKLSMDKGYPGAKPYIVPEEKGRRVIIAAHKAGWQLYIHITTPETFDYVSAAMEEAYRLYPREDARHIFTHIHYPTQENIDTMKRLGIIADLQVNRIYHLDDEEEEKDKGKIDPKRPNLGPKPVATYRDAGIPVILSSDQAPVGPLFSIWEAVNRVRKSGKVYQPEEQLTLEEAIRAVTITSAWTFFEDDVKGSIEAGKFADRVVLGKDILTVDPMDIKDIPVLMTMTGGKLVYVNSNQDPDQEVKYYRYPARTSYLD